ncbi:DUF3772 domain-containing protein [Roseateles chitosanitabidus]|uniref:DUF3772 domain-containing protein n=1 Tax=Roseateles chitosanitabidus TaxID=65048 RepID=UPI000A02626A|nr:DUF3772 domain-containing protein [Roseateles chitosanitabidus]
MRVPFLTRLLVGLAVVLAALIGMHGPAFAQGDEAAPVDPAVQLDTASKDMAKVHKAVADKNVSDAALQVARKQAQTAAATAEDVMGSYEKDLGDAQLKLKQLGEPTAGVKEPADVAAQRAQLQKQVAALDGQVKRAKLLKVEADQAVTAINEARRQQLGARLAERAPSVLQAGFWEALGDDLDRDLPALRGFGTELDSLARAVAPRAWAMLAGGIVLLLIACILLRRVLTHLSVTRIPAGRLRRSLNALGEVALRTLRPGLIAHGLVLALLSGATPSTRLASWLDTAEAIAWFAGFVAGLGAALLLPAKPSWRLPSISDATATRLAWLPRTLAVVSGLGWLASRTASLLDAGEATTWLVDLISTLLLMAILAGGLGLIARARDRLSHHGGSGAAPARDEHAAVARQGRQDDDAQADREIADAAKDAKDADKAAAKADIAKAQEAALAARPMWLSVLRGAGWLALIAAGLALLIGFIPLAMFGMNQLAWGVIVLCSAYLLVVLVDDLFMTLLAPSGAAAAAAQAKDGEPAKAAGAAAQALPSQLARTREQAAVLLSGLCRVLVGFFAVILLLAPYGEGPLDLARRAGSVQNKLSLGGLTLAPTDLLWAAAMLVLGMVAVQLLKRWLTLRVMPTTRMDAGMRGSATTLFGYAGNIAVIATSLSIVGFNLERIAWVASALSVGIGFGLQAVVQNFVSGLILLAERPVKVGDWVSLSGVEGDVRRINVRATEIQMGDRSTVIVPNSEFITKIVRNVTYGESLGLVQFKLPLPIATDISQVRETILAIFRAHPGVLPAPAPNVQLDGVDGIHLILNVTGFVNSPRAAYGVKSDVLFEVLKQLREADALPLAAGPALLAALTGQGPPLPPASPAR